MQTDEHRLLRDSLREFAANRLTPFAADWDRNATFPKQALSELAALGAFGVGILESFASFQSSALKDVIVFSLLIPILLWRSFASQHSEEEVEE